MAGLLHGFAPAADSDELERLMPPPPMIRVPPGYMPVFNPQCVRDPIVKPGSTDKTNNSQSLLGPTATGLSYGRLDAVSRAQLLNDSSSGRNKIRYRWMVLCFPLFSMSKRTRLEFLLTFMGKVMEVCFRMPLISLWSYKLNRLSKGSSDKDPSRNYLIRAKTVQHPGNVDMHAVVVWDALFSRFLHGGHLTFGVFA